MDPLQDLLPVVIEEQVSLKMKEEISFPEMASPFCELSRTQSKIDFSCSGERQHFLPQVARQDFWAFVDISEMDHQYTVEGTS